MKIAVIENYKCSHSSYRAGRSGGEWDYEDTSSYSYNYYFTQTKKKSEKQSIELSTISLNRRISPIQNIHMI